MSTPSVRNHRVRLSRDERRARTRDDLVATARQVFEQRGFHRASLEEIAEAAGYSKGAVYSNFRGKDELFLAVYAEVVDQRVADYTALTLDAPTWEAGVRAVAEHQVRAARGAPAWSALLTEFWIHASHDVAVRDALGALNDRQQEAIADMLDALVARHGLVFTVPTRDVVRASGALGRGMGLERLLAPDLPLEDVFIPAFVALNLGLTRPA
ncbi:MAG TPA: TetR/AcrR family transcriptional regulator [Solirubrobacteraceae bacterium]|nr:TetR/AcrR family transcriptional regulator [Solirubrobacteraceae bacterium]